MIKSIVVETSSLEHKGDGLCEIETFGNGAQFQIRFETIDSSVSVRIWPAQLHAIRDAIDTVIKSMESWP